MVIGIKPLLGFELIAQGQLLQWLICLKELFATNEETAGLWEELAGHIEDTSQLEELINMLAWSHVEALEVKVHVCLLPLVHHAPLPQPSDTEDTGSVPSGHGLLPPQPIDLIGEEEFVSA